jgi:hypothetical protein
MSTQLAVRGAQFNEFLCALRTANCAQETRCK